MYLEIQIQCISIAIEAFYNHIKSTDDSNSEAYTKVANQIFFELEKQNFGNYWHIIVGDNFGSFVTHQSNSFIFFEINSISIQIFRTA